MSMSDVQDRGTSQQSEILAFQRLTLTETRLTHEFTLAGHRMAWLVSSQAFLFGAWVSLVRKIGELEASDALVLSAVIPVVGFVTAVAGGLATAAAVRMVDILVAERARYDVVVGIKELSSLRPSSWTRVAGHIPTGVLPVVFAVSWSTIVLNQLFHGTRYAGMPLILGALVFLAAWVVIWFIWSVHRHLQDQETARQSRHEASVATKASS
jgi:uncharacterized integral membrane protein